MCVFLGFLGFLAFLRPIPCVSSVSCNEAAIQTRMGVYVCSCSANSVELVEPECTGTTVPPDLQVTCKLSQDED